jgi:DNA-binding MarR family transcriptional regulator
MNQELMDMAVKAGIQEGEFERYKGEDGKRKAYMMLPEELEAFAKLVAAAEREACAKLCDVLAVHPEYASEVTKLAAAAIRARGETK